MNAEANPEPTPRSERVPKERSPGYPRVPLEDSIATVKELYVKARRTEFPRDRLLELLGYTSLHGAAVAVISSLHLYGLLVRTRHPPGEHGKRYRLSDIAHRIIHPVDESQAAEAIREAALQPEVFRTVFVRGYHRSPESGLAKFLMQDTFTPEGARLAAAIYRKNAEFARLDELPDIPENFAVRDPTEPYLGSPKLTEQEEAAFAHKLALASNRPGSPTTADSTKERTQSLPAERTAPANPTELSIPLEEGRAARIPCPMTGDSFELLVGTLQLWKKRLIKETSEPSSGS